MNSRVEHLCQQRTTFWYRPKAAMVAIYGLLAAYSCSYEAVCCPVSARWPLKQLKVLLECKGSCWQLEAD
jgi:hypothetical protein